MTSRDFCYWLQGYLEIGAAGTQNPNGQQLQAHVNGAQVACIQQHLAMVFKHEIDPSAGPKPHQDALNELHNQPGSQDGILYRC